MFSVVKIFEKSLIYAMYLFESENVLTGISRREVWREVLDKLHVTDNTENVWVTAAVVEAADRLKKHTRLSLKTEKYRVMIFKSNLLPHFSRGEMFYFPHPSIKVQCNILITTLEI